MVGINKSPVLYDLETIFSRVRAEVSPKALGRGEMVALILQNPFLTADRTANSSSVWIGNATNQLYLAIPGQESPILYAEDLKDLYIKIDFPATNPNGEILTVAVSASDRGTGYTVGNVLTLHQVGSTNTGTVTVATTNTGITAATLNAGGAGYAVNDTVTVNGGSSLATIVIDTVDGGGAVLTFHVQSTGGNGYAVAAGVATTTVTGVGVGFKVNITQVRGSILTVTLTNGGLNYTPGVISAANVTGGSGSGVVIVILTVDTVNEESVDVNLIIYRQRKGGRQ